MSVNRGWNSPLPKLLYPLSAREDLFILAAILLSLINASTNMFRPQSFIERRDGKLEQHKQPPDYYGLINPNTTLGERRGFHHVEYENLQCM